MAGSWHDVLADQAELLLGRLEDGVWAGLGLLRTRLGLDLGLEPWLKRQPPGSAGLALVLLLLLLLLLPPVLWALGRRLLFPRKRPSSPQQQQQQQQAGGRRGGSGGARNREKTPGDVQQQRIEEQKRRNKRKEKPKKSQPNGRAGSEPLEEEILHPFEKLIVKQLDTEKKTEKTKKNKKKPKAEMKQLQDEPQNWAEGKETDEGAWETKISSREKRQQRRRDKGINETSSVDSSLPAVGSEAVPAQQHTVASAGLGPRKTKGVETAVAPGWGEQLTVNGGSWCDIPVKLPSQVNATKDDKWRQMPVLANAKRSPDQPAWGQEGGDTNAGTKEWAVPLVDKTWSEHALFPSIGAWAGVNDRMNTSEQKPPFSNVGTKAAVAGASSEPASQSSTADPHWDANPAPSPIDDAWSGINGTSTADPSSDWNAPTEEWGNWLVEEPAPTAQPEDVISETQKLSDEDKEKVDSGLQGSANNKSKKKKKKKKKGEEATAPAQETEEQEKESISGDQEQLVVQDQPEKETAAPVETICTSEPAEVEEAQPVEVAEEPAVIVENSSQDITSQVPDTLSETETSVSVTKQNNLPPSQAKSEENWESPKQIKKKKRARRET
ncbi:protein LYRIC-like isoform X1 [Carcharodon carcharias]|uniref:protein LYRIC-like isoform X1 n=1 Tax=Carcharodon carcharias TaxID=13397 RepID=UPI001B7F60DB|nr:protein LYRIC-like isoform X1 [Carcharodon carcharias]